MATVKIWKVTARLDRVISYVSNIEKTENKGYEEANLNALNDTLNYTIDPSKTEDKYFVSGINCQPEFALEQMTETKKSFKKTGGILAFHAYQSFAPNEVTPLVAHEIGKKFANKMWGDRFEVVVSTHVNSHCVHNHFLINSVSFLDGKKYYDNKNNYAKMRELSDELCREYRLSVIEKPSEGRTKSYNEIEAHRNPDIFMSYLDVQSRFDRYSVSNALLVAYQMPEATRLCDSKTWKEHDVFIRKGESAIIILEPGREFKRQDGSIGTNYNAKKVFDVSQTTAKQYPKTQKTYNERTLVRALVKQSSVPVEISDKVPEEAGAVYQPEGKRILIRKGMPGDEIFRCLSREIAHAKLDKGDYSREKCKTAALAISFITCERFGIEPQQIKGDELFKGMDSKSIRKELSGIRTEANSIIASITKTLEVKNKDVR